MIIIFEKLFMNFSGPGKKNFKKHWMKGVKFKDKKISLG